MRKDFERAYRELAKGGAPDLWDRIEAGLGEKSTQDGAGAEPDMERASASDGKPLPGGKKFLLMIRKYSAMAAALICVIIIIPVLIRVNRSSGAFENDSSSAAADMTASEEAGEEAAIEGGGSAAGHTAASEEKTSGESMTTESAADEAEAVSGEKVEKQEREEAGSMPAAEEQRAEKAMEDMAAAEQLRDDEAREATVLSHVILEVTGSADLPVGEKLGEAGVVYTAVVRRDPAGILKEGEEITVFIPAYSAIALIKDAAFELDLCPQESEEYSFVVCGYYNQTEE